MRIVHLSDVHHEIGNTEQVKVINALCQDLKKAAAQQQIDVVVFSGDLASKGNTADIAIDAIYEEIIQPIKVAIGYDVKFITCPGNHDINLKARNKVYTPIFDAIQTPQAASELIDTVHVSADAIWDHTKGYLKLAKKISSIAYSTNNVFDTLRLSKNNVSYGFASLNSAWLTRGGGTIDYGKLFVGERQIDLALKEIADCEVKIAVMHHSLGWLHPQEYSVVQRVLASNFQAVLCGHNHDNNATSITSNLGAMFVSNTGCMYQTIEYFNGYSILEIDLENRKWIVDAREYFFQRNQFDISPRFSDGGRSEYPLKDEPGKNVVVISANVITEIQERAGSKLLSYAASEVAPKQVGAMFVDPLIAQLSEKQFFAANQDSNAEYITVSQLAADPESLLIVGKRESGKTVLLHQIAANRFIEFNAYARIGLVVDLSTISRNTEAAILEQLVEGTGGEIPRRHIVDLLLEGRVLVCIDNIHIHSEKQIALIKGFCEKYSKNKYIFAASEEFFEPVNVGDSLPNLGIPFRRVYIHSLRRKQIREMARKWFGDASEVTNGKYELVNQLLERLNVPTTPFLVSVLLWVLEQRPNASPVNQAAAIEVLIDGLLEKFKESKSRMNFDSIIQKHFLSDFSEHLDRIGAEWIPAIDFDEFVVSYFKRKGLQVSTTGFADELHQKGLLYAASDRVAFKFDCFRAYFLAQRFADTPDLWKKALSKAEIHRYSTELDLFTGLHRDRRDVLATSVEICKQLFQSTGMDIELEKVHELGKSVPLMSDLNLDSLEQDVLGDAYDSNAREDRLAEMERPSRASVDHDSARKRNQFGQSSDQMNFIASLRILSIVVRNSELVDDLDLKRSGVSLAIEYWAKIMVSTVDFVANMDMKDPKLLEHFLFEIKDEERLRNFLMLVFPQALLSMMSECLATSKLQTFLATLNNADAPIISCLSALVALEGGEKDGAAMVRSTLRKHGTNNLIVQIIFFKLMSVYSLKYLDRDKVHVIRECLAEAFTLSRGASAKAKAQTSAKFLETLDKRITLNKVGTGDK